ncbi:hypothetical protein DL96DRAFT_1640821 [Flagelloscypha sp. PMI_526]|nr:hypothetical protein DL96DRAFT_1640821 [Flagelloscypha sp. PMI_526]
MHLRQREQCARRSHLRLWLRHEENVWKIPQELEDLRNKLYCTAKPAEQEVPVEPEILHASEKSHDDEGKEG